MKPIHLLACSLFSLLCPSSAAEPVLCGVPPKASDLIVIESVSVAAPEEENTSETRAHRKEKPISLIDREIAKLTPQERNSLLSLINNGTLVELVSIKGVAETRANTILSSRPIFELQDLTLLRGFGPGIIAKVLAHKDEAVK